MDYVKGVRYDENGNTRFIMAFCRGLPAFRLDMKEFTERDLGLNLEEVDLQWITRAVYTRVNDVIKYTYCLHALKYEVEGRELTPPQYYKGIQSLRRIASNLLRERTMYWNRQARTLFFVQNISFGNLLYSPPPMTDNQSTGTEGAFAVPQDYRQRPADEGADRNQEANNTTTSTSTAVESRYSHPKWRRKTSRPDKKVYVVPAKRYRPPSSPDNLSQDDLEENWDA